MTWEPAQREWKQNWWLISKKLITEGNASCTTSSRLKLYKVHKGTKNEDLGHLQTQIGSSDRVANKEAFAIMITLQQVVVSAQPVLKMGSNFLFLQWLIRIRRYQPQPLAGYYRSLLHEVKCSKLRMAVHDASEEFINSGSISGISRIETFTNINVLIGIKVVHNSLPCFLAR